MTALEEFKKFKDEHWMTTDPLLFEAQKRGNEAIAEVYRSLEQAEANRDEARRVANIEADNCTTAEAHANNLQAERDALWRAGCRDCKFQDREMVRVENEHGQLVSIEDTICGIFDVFMPDEGFCSFWESK